MPLAINPFMLAAVQVEFAAQVVNVAVVKTVVVAGFAAQTVTVTTLVGP